MAALTAAAPGYVSTIAVVELVWVLSDCYAMTQDELCDTLEKLLRTKQIVVANADTVWQALRAFKSGKADFADCLIERFGQADGCDYTMTFDRDAARQCGMHLVE